MLKLVCVVEMLLVDQVCLGVPKGVFNVVLGDGKVGEKLISHDAVRKVSFTGSVETGRRVYQQCALGIKPVTMELGGKSALIVFDGIGSSQE
jgi:betaine-aldehyde dehydrogenase